MKHESRFSLAHALSEKLGECRSSRHNQLPLSRSAPRFQCTSHHMFMCYSADSGGPVSLGALPVPAKIEDLARAGVLARSACH